MNDEILEENVLVVVEIIDDEAEKLINFSLERKSLDLASLYVDIFHWNTFVQRPSYIEGGLGHPLFNALYRIHSPSCRNAWILFSHKRNHPSYPLTD
jgi:hypothetical protein